ncbi:MAG: hypothetical protein DWG80_05425 [Chloroflexi bacterium]|nr:hypothetical protein [Chloroflexota bacterium]
MTPAPRPWPSRRFILTVAPVVLLVIVASLAISTRLRGDTTPGAVVLPPGVPRIVFAEFGLNEDRIYSAPADALHDRTLQATVPHAPGWGLNPGVAIAGALVAYTILPEDASPERGSPAELWILDITTRDLTRLARDADLLAPPVFVDDGDGLVYRRSMGAVQELVHVEVSNLTREVVHSEQTSFGIFPLGTAHDQSLLFTRISPEGTDLLAIRAGETPSLLFRASEDIARDWRISPDGRAISYLAPVIDGERAVHRAHVVSLDTSEDLLPADEPEGAARALTEQYGPVWTPDGRAITYGQEAATGDAEPAAVVALDGSRDLLPAPEHGFDVPLGWSKDGRFLLVRSFNGRNSNEPGVERTILIDLQGGRTPVEVPSEVIFLGWYVRA